MIKQHFATFGALLLMFSMVGVAEAQQQQWAYARLETSGVWIWRVENTKDMVTGPPMPPAEFYQKAVSVAMPAGGGSNYDDGFLLTLMNGLGARCWELVAVSDKTFYFKRKV